VVLLMVQKSQSQSPGMVPSNPVNNGIKRTNLNWSNLAGFLVAINQYFSPWKHLPSKNHRDVSTVSHLAGCPQGEASAWPT